MSRGVDGRAPCLVGVARRTWHPDEVAEAGAPEPLAMWADVARAAARDAAAPAGADTLLARLDALSVVYCQTWQYDDPPGRLAAALGITPRIAAYSGIGGTTPLVLLAEHAAAMGRGELDAALVVGAEGLATGRRLRLGGGRPAYSFPSPERRPFPFEAPFHPAEVAHDVFQAWLTFAVFDDARRAHRAEEPDAYRRALGELWAPFTEVAAAEPGAWFRQARRPDELATPSPENRLVATPYTKRMVAIMDVDMAAALVLATHEWADELGVPPERRVYLRGLAAANDPVYVAEHPDLWRSPAMEEASRRALAAAGAGIDEVAHLDLYSCFGSSVHFARDALDLAPRDPRRLTVTGGLPYHGGPGSNYLTHATAAMADVLRADAGSFGLVSGVGMHMTKHAFGVWSTEPGGGVADPTATPPGAAARLVEEHEGEAEVAAATVVYGRDGEPEWALLVCDVAPGVRTYARLDDPDDLARAAAEGIARRSVRLAPADATSAFGVEVRRNAARL